MKRYVQNLLIAAVSVLLVLAASEIVFRIAVYKSLLVNSNSTTNHHKTFCEYDPLLGWRHKKNAEARFITGEYDVSLKFNSKGMRGPEIDYKKGESVYRILILGDSFAESYTVDLKDSFPEALRKNLIKRTGSDFEIINAGVGGYSTDQEFLYMKEEGSKFCPDLTILMFYENDVYYNARPKYWRGFKPYFALENGDMILKNNPVPAGPVQSKDNRILRFFPRSYLFSYLIDRLKTKADNKKHQFPDEYRIRLIKYDQETEDSWKITEKIIQELKLLIIQMKGRMMVVYVPPSILVDDRLYSRYIKTYSYMRNEIDIQKPRSVLKDICSRNEIDYLDLTDYLRSRSKDQYLYYKRDGHWNKEGHNAVAEALAGHIFNDYIDNGQQFRSL